MGLQGRRVAGLEVTQAFEVRLVLPLHGEEARLPVVRRLCPPPSTEDRPIKLPHGLRGDEAEGPGKQRPVEASRPGIPSDGVYAPPRTPRKVRWEFDGSTAEAHLGAITLAREARDEEAGSRPRGFPC